MLDDFYIPGILKWVEVEDKLDHHHLHHDPVMSLDLNLEATFQKSQLLPMGSVDGLLCLWQFDKGKDETYICNPITREYMTLTKQHDYKEGNSRTVYGFGVGSLTKEYKVIRVIKIPNQTSTSRFEAEVYTLGTGQWRSLGHVPHRLGGYFYGQFLNGRAHWSILDQDSTEKICTFDFDNETFELFPSPPVENMGLIINKTLGVLKGCLCQCDTFDSQFMIWVMKEYGMKTSWHKEVIIKPGTSPLLNRPMWYPVCPIERLHDQTILMVYYREKLLAYSFETKTIEDTKIFDRFFIGMAYRPSFFKLQNFKLESVHVFEVQ